ncbi:unnamed protein product [Strongylus vulgaris]|uniref:Ig-like domain-containing protein n=1 Tax=Strongylus vulgaris TaxID=40348 RepID=A0A3P7JSS3_STRVU|nr:unnamed protein product [Strongylus vulgaris]
MLMRLTLLVFTLIFEAVCSEVYSVPRLVITPDTNPVQKPAGAQIPLLCKVERISEDIRPGIIWVKHDGLDRCSQFTENFDFADKKTDIGYVMPSAAVNLSCEVTPSSVKVRTMWTRGGVPIAQGLCLL